MSLHTSMDHLLSAGYLVESGVSSTSFSTRLLTFPNQQTEQVGISCKNMINTFSPIHRQVVEEPTSTSSLR